MSEKQVPRTYGQIWERYKAEFMPKGLTERELRQIHVKWIDARAYADRGIK